MRNKVARKIAALLVLSLVLAGIAPSMKAEAAASIYKKFPTYTRYENKFGKAGMTANAGALEQLLGAKSYVYVYLRNLKTAETYTIPANSKFADKRLRVNAPNSKVVNHASMKIVKITAVGEEGWTEYGKGNSFAVVDPDVKMEVGTGATVDKLYFQAANGKVDLEINGDVTKTGFYGDKMDANVTISEGTTKEFRVATKDGKVEVTMEKASEVNTVKIVKDADVVLNVNDGVEKVVLDAPANVTITGDSEKVKEVAVEVNAKAEGASVTSDVPVKAEVEAKAEINLKEGAEGSTIQKADEKVEVEIKNETKENVTVSTEGKTETETVPGTNPGSTTGGGGSTGGGSTVGGNTTPVNPDPTPTPGPSEGGDDPVVTPTESAIGITVTASGTAVVAEKTGNTFSASVTVPTLSAVINVSLSGIEATSITGVSPVAMNFDVEATTTDDITITINTDDEVYTLIIHVAVAETTTPVGPGEDDEPKDALITNFEVDTRENYKAQGQDALDNDGKYEVAGSYNDKDRILTVTASAVKSQLKTEDNGDIPTASGIWIGIGVKIISTTGVTVGAIQYSKTGKEDSYVTMTPEEGVKDNDVTFIFYPDVTTSTTVHKRYLKDANENVYEIHVAFEEKEEEQ